MLNMWSHAPRYILSTCGHTHFLMTSRRVHETRCALPAHVSRTLRLKLNPSLIKIIKKSKTNEENSFWVHALYDEESLSIQINNPFVQFNRNPRQIPHTHLTILIPTRSLFLCVSFTDSEVCMWLWNPLLLIDEWYLVWLILWRLCVVLGLMQVDRKKWT